MMDTWSGVIGKVLRAIELEVTHDKGDSVASQRTRQAALEAVDAAKAFLQDGGSFADPLGADRSRDARDTDPPASGKKARIEEVSWGTIVVDDATGMKVTSGARRSDVLYRARAKGYDV